MFLAACPASQVECQNAGCRPHIRQSASQGELHPARARGSGVDVTRRFQKIACRIAISSRICRGTQASFIFNALSAPKYVPVPMPNVHLAGVPRHVSRRESDVQPGGHAVSVKSTSSTHSDILGHVSVQTTARYLGCMQRIRQFRWKLSRSRALPRSVRASEQERMTGHSDLRLCTTLIIDRWHGGHRS